MGSGSHAGIYPKERRFRKSIVDALNKVAGLKAYERADIPEELHYKLSSNSPPVLVMADMGTVILAG